MFWLAALITSQSMQQIWTMHSANASNHLVFWLTALITSAAGRAGPGARVEGRGAADQVCSPRPYSRTPYGEPLLQL